MYESAVKRYYDRHLNDPNHNIPAPQKSFGPPGKRFTQKQISDLIGYLANDNMPLKSAAEKVNMSVYSARRYYDCYLHDPDHKIPTAQRNSGTRFTQEQIAELIGYIANDKMPISIASAKLNMGGKTAKKHYDRYLKDQANKQKPEVTK